MKRILVLVLFFFTLKSVENEIFSLKGELEKFVLENLEEFKTGEWDKICDNFKRYKTFKDQYVREVFLVSKDQHILNTYDSLKYFVPENCVKAVSHLIDDKLDEIVKKNKIWLRAEKFGLKEAYIKLIKLNRANNKDDSAITEEYSNLYREALDRSTQPERDASHSKAIEEVFDLLDVIVKQLNLSFDKTL